MSIIQATDFKGGIFKMIEDVVERGKPTGQGRDNFRLSKPCRKHPDMGMGRDGAFGVGGGGWLKPRGENSLGLDV